MKKIDLSKSFILVLAGVALVACSNTSRREEPQLSNRLQAQQVDAAARNNASFVSTVQFERGSKAVPATSSERLRELVMNAKASGKIEEIRVAVWADETYPSTSKKRLSSEQRKLAKERAANIEDFLKEDLDVDDVETFNMAERPNMVENFFNTSDAKVKRALESSGMTANADVLADSTSKATVMIIMED